MPILRLDEVVKRRPRRRRHKVIQAFDAKRAMTRFGVVEMPKQLDPDSITTEQLLTDRRLKLIPKTELTEPVLRMVEKFSTEKLPVLHLKPVLTDRQLCMLQIAAELDLQGKCDWETAYYHYGVINQHPENMAEMYGKRVGDSLVVRRLLNAAGLPTLQGRKRLRQQEEVEWWTRRLGLSEYPLERIERTADPNYDEIYFIRGDYIECFYRHECFEVRARKVILSSLLAT